MLLILVQRLALNVLHSMLKCCFEGIGYDHSNPHYSRALPGKNVYERLSPYIAFQPHDIIRHILQQTTQLANYTIHYPIQRHLNRRFKC
jgi:hypothetical protein